MRANFRPHLNATDLSGKNPSCPLASTEPAESPDWLLPPKKLEIFQLLGSCSFSFWLVVGSPTPLKNMRKSKWIRFPRIRGENKKKYLSCHLPPPSCSMRPTRTLHLCNRELIPKKSYCIFVCIKCIKSNPQDGLAALYDWKSLPVTPKVDLVMLCWKIWHVTPLKTNMTLENPPFEDVFPIENGDFPMSC